MNPWPARKDSTPINFKKWFASTAIVGAIISFFSRFTQAELTTAQGSEIARFLPELVTVATSMWPLLLGILADLRIMVLRIKATKFNLSFWKSEMFWTGLFGAIMTVLQLLGVNWEGLEGFLPKLGAFVSSLAAFTGTVLVFIGRFRATKPIAIK